MIIGWVWVVFEFCFIKKCIGLVILFLIFLIVDLWIGRIEFFKLIILFDFVFVVNLINLDAVFFLLDFVVIVNC